VNIMSSNSSQVENFNLIKNYFLFFHLNNYILNLILIVLKMILKFHYDFKFDFAIS